MAQIFLPEVVNNIKIFGFEGADGGGKSTQVRLVVPKLVAAGFDAVAVACPSDSVVGQFLRQNLGELQKWERQSLFLMDMAGILERQSKPGRILIADRWVESSVVSNRDTEPAESAKWFESLPKAKRVFVFDISPEEVLRSRSESVHDHSIDVAWQEMKRRRYLDLAKQEPKRTTVVDAAQDRDVITALLVSTILADLRSENV